MTSIMDVQAIAEHAQSLFSAVAAQAEELQQRAVQRLVDSIGIHHEAWRTERLQLLEQLQEAKGRAQVLEGTLQRYQEEQTCDQQRASRAIELSYELQKRLQQAKASALEKSQQHADELAKTRDQLKVALEYRKKCKAQQAEIKNLQQRIAALQSEQQHASELQHASEQNRHAEDQPAHQPSAKESLPTAGSLQKPAHAAHGSVHPTHSQDACTQDDQVLCNQIAGLLQRLQEAEGRVQQEAQKRHAERKNVREVLRKRDEEQKALKAENQAFRSQLIQLGALQPPQRSGTPGPRTELPQEYEATSRPARGSAKESRQPAGQPRAVPPAEATPKAAARDVAGSLSQARAHDSASARKSVLRAGSGSCSRAAEYEGKQDRGISPGKRATPDVANATAAQQRATPAKRPKRDTRSTVDKQRQKATAGSAPSVRHAAGAPGMQDEQEGQHGEGRVEEPALASKRTLQPADVAHLQSAQNVRNSQGDEHGEEGTGSQPTESPQPSVITSPSQLASTAVPLCPAADEHPHRSFIAAPSGRAAAAPDICEGITLTLTAPSSADRKTGSAGMVAPQPEPVSRPPGIPVSREAHSQLQPGLKKPETEPRMAAESAQLDSPARPALPAVPEEESAELALAVVKEESLRSSPAWKVRAAREAAQHTGNTLFADICQPDLAEEAPDDLEGAGLLTQLLGPNRHTAQEQQKAGASWKTRQREGLCPGALAFLDVAHVQRSSNPRTCQRLPAIVDRHSPKGPQPQRDAVQARVQHTKPPNAGPGYKYKEVARKRAEREAMLGVECPDCQRFYEACQTWNSIEAAALPKCGHAVQDVRQKARVASAPEKVTRDELRQNASRHRYHYAPPPTPPGFWDMGFMDTQDSRCVGKDE